jgi:hypothetical protein
MWLLFHTKLGIGKVVDSKEVGLIEVLREIERFILRSKGNIV